MEDLRLGLVGAGRWGQRYIATIGSMTGVSLGWIASRNPETAALAPDAAVFPDWRQLVELDLDGVVIAAPPAVHGEMLRAFVDVRVPVMVEKPLCLDVEEARGLQYLVGARGIPVLVDHTQLFNPAYEALKVRAEFLGPVRFIRSDSMGFGPFRPDVGVLWDWAPHDISLCLDLLGAVPSSVSALGDRSAVTLWLEFDGGPSAWIALTNLSREKRRSLSVHFDDRLLVFNDVANDKLIEHEVDFASECIHHPGLDPGTVLPVEDSLPLTCAVENFLRGVRGGGTAGFGLDLACQVIEVIDAAERSMSLGRPQPVLAQAK